LKAYRVEIETEGIIRGAAREIGRLVETGSYISNTSLYYALGISKSQYAETRGEPDYINQTADDKSIYIAPARPINETKYTNLLTTVSGNKYAEQNLSAQDPDNEVADMNFPKKGTEKVVTSENKFETFILSEEELDLPRYFRLGKKRGKCSLTVEEVEVEEREGEFTTSHPIGAYDTELNPQGNLLTRKIRPAPLILQALYEGPYYELKYGDGEKATLPGDLEFLKQKR
jgi:CRISPR-associated protein Csc1